MEPQAPIRQKIIREIKPSPVLQARTRNHKLRVAAYCRVSTEQEEQQTSIENQITYYDDLIRSNPEWEYAGVFSDDGISGTRDENRPGFMEMIKQCKKRENRHDTGKVAIQIFPKYPAMHFVHTNAQGSGHYHPV